MLNGKVIALLLVALFALPLLPVLEMGTRAQTQAQGFQIISAQWGTPTTSAEAGPGDQDVPLTLLVQYLYPYEALFAQLNVKLPNGFTSTSAATSPQATSNATIYYTSKLLEGQVFQLETFLNLGKNVSLEKYQFAATFLWSAILSNSTSEPQVPLEQNILFSVSVQGNAKLTFSTPNHALVAGSINNLTLVLSNLGSGNVSNIQATVTSSNPQSVSVLNEIPLATQLAANESTSFALELFVAASTAGSAASLSLSTTYIDAYSNQQSTTQILGLFVASTSATPSLVYRALTSSLLPGQVNNISMTITNEGNVALYGINTQVASPAQSVSVLGQPKGIANLSTGTSASFEIALFVSGTASNSPVTLSLSAGYTIAGNNDTGSVSQTLGLYVSSAQSAADSSSLSVSTLAGNLTTGKASTVSFEIRNTGSSAIYDPSFSLSVASPLVVTTNSSYTWGNGVLPSQSGFVYEAKIVTSPSSSSGVYDGTLTINYSNQYGIASSQTVQVGFVLTGVIELVVQDETITQGTGNLTVSGTLLNEGTAAAYYASAFGYLAPNSKPGQAAYIGEIDPNTPVPFTATVPYTASASPTRGGVIVVISYRDNFENALTMKNNDTTTIAPLQPATSPTTGAATSTAGEGLVILVFYAIIGVLVVAAIAGVVVVRRRRRAANLTLEDSKVV